MFENIKLQTIGDVDFTKGTITLPMKEWEKWEADKRKLAELINYMQDQLKIWDAHHCVDKHYVFMNNERLIIAECDDNSLLEQAIIAAKKDLYEEHKKLENEIKAREQLKGDMSYYISKVSAFEKKQDKTDSNISKAIDILTNLRSKWYLGFLHSKFTKIIDILS